MKKPSFCPVSVANLNRFNAEDRFDFGDKRLYDRSLCVLSAMTRRRSGVPHRFLSNLGDLRGGYRFLSNPKVKVEELMGNSFGIKPEIVKGRDVLLLSDGSGINCTSAVGGMGAAELAKLGVLEDNKTPGFQTHASFCLDGNTSEALGLCDVIMFNRPKQEEADRNAHRKKDYDQKETSNWEQGCINSLHYLESAKSVTAVFDRGADRFEVMQRTLSIPDLDILFRISYNRKVKVNGEATTLEQLAECEAQGSYMLKIKALNHKSSTGRTRKKRKKRTSKMEVRWSCIDEITITKDHKYYKSLKNKGSIIRKLYVVDVREILSEENKDEEPIHWKLLTTHPVTNLEQARKIINWYKQRWHIEQLFRTLKSKGLAIEDARLQSVDALMKNAVLAFVAAAKIMQLNLAREITKGRSIEVVFDQQEVLVLKKLTQKLEGATKLQKNPFSPTELSYATWVMGRLGGWKGYYSQGPPGPITICKGYYDFQTIMQGVRLLN